MKKFFRFEQSSPLLNKIFLLLIITTNFCIVPAQNLPKFHITVYNKASTGYYFLCPTKPGNMGGYSPQMILDDKGNVVYYKNQNSTDFQIQNNGEMTYGSKGKFYIMDSNFVVIDSVSCKHGIMTDMHDFQILPDGHFLMLGTETTTMDLSSYNMFNHNGSPGSSSATVKCGVVQELDASKNVVFEWHAKDYFNFDDVDSTFLSSPTNVDWTHFNALTEDTDGNILLSVRHFDEITKINRTDSSIIWRLGGKHNQFTFANDLQKFHGQHNISRIANGDITMLDNGSLNPLHPVQAKEYRLNLNTMTATLVWSYLESPDTYSQSTGNVQRLNNGNTLIDYGNLNNLNLMFNVVDSSGNKIFETVFDDTLSSYRVYNYPSLPWQLRRPQIYCYRQNNQLYLDAGSGYSSYLWSTGETTESIAVNSADTFYVFVPIGSGGFISSEKYIVSNPDNTCIGESVKTITNSPEFSVFPNPVIHNLTIESNTKISSITRVTVTTMLGEIVKEFSINMSSGGSNYTINMDKLPANIYWVTIVTNDGRQIFKVLKMNN